MKRRFAIEILKVGVRAHGKEKENGEVLRIDGVGLAVSWRGMEHVRAGIEQRRAALIIKGFDGVGGDARGEKDFKAAAVVEAGGSMDGESATIPGLGKHWVCAGGKGLANDIGRAVADGSPEGLLIWGSRSGGHTAC